MSEALPNKQIFEFLNKLIQNLESIQFNSRLKEKERKDLIKELISIRNKLSQNYGEIIGSGFMDTIKKGVNFLKTVPFRAKHLLNPTGRDNKPTARFENYLDQNKDKKIESISVGKIPLSKGISTALYVLSGGKSAQKMKELDYDELYHQYMIVKYKDGTIRKIEKNAVVEEGKPNQKELDNLHFTLPVKKDLTLKEMMDTASYNDSTYWKYDSGEKNCQIFIKNSLERNNLIQPLETGKILANPKAQEIINTLPAPIRGLPLVITNLASSLDAVYYGGANGTVKVFDKRGVSNPMLYSQLIVNGLL